MLLFKELVALDEEFGMNIDFNHWLKKVVPSMKESSVGYVPLRADKKKVFRSIGKDLHKSSLTKK